MDLGVAAVGDRASRSCPSRQCARHIGSQGHAYSAVVPLHLTVGLWVVRHREQVSDSQGLTDRLKMFGRKLLAIVGQKEDRRAVREDLMVAERRHHGVGTCRPERDSSCQLRVSVSDDQQVLVPVFGLPKWT